MKSRSRRETRSNSIGMSREESVCERRTERFWPVEGGSVAIQVKPLGGVLKIVLKAWVDERRFRNAISAF